LQERALPRGGKTNGNIDIACGEVSKSRSSRRTSRKVLAGTDGNRTRITLAREQASIGPNMHRLSVRGMAGIHCCWAMLGKNLLHLLTTSHGTKQAFAELQQSAQNPTFAVSMTHSGPTALLANIAKG
jgi:hypothetical protein